MQLSTNTNNVQKPEDIRKLSKSNQTLQEIEELAEEIRYILTQNQGITLKDFMEVAFSINMKDLGYRLGMALKCDRKLESFFPDEVFAILKQRAIQTKMFYFSKKDDDFLQKNWNRGYKWLANQMYANVKSIRDYAQKKCLKMENDDVRVITPEIEEFIKKHADKGVPWLSNTLKIPGSTIRQYGKRTGIQFLICHKRKDFSPEEDRLIKDNISKGTLWLANILNRTSGSVGSRARRLNIQIPIIHKNKVCHRFTKKDDAFIFQNAKRGMVWLAKKMNLSENSIQYRARAKSIKIKSHRRIYSENDIKFIKENIHKGIPFLANQLSVPCGALKSKLKKIN